jgi:hypothetical protein
VDTSSHYRTAATATGVWAHELLSAAPDVPITDAVDDITAVVEDTGVPLTGYARSSGGFTSSVLLVRDPSITHGVPDVPDCERAARALAAGGRWRSEGQLIRASILVAVGLREGYDPAARVHAADELEQRVLRAGAVWAGWEVELISARPQPDGGVQLYHEPGVLTFADWEQLPVLAAIAHDLGQHRFVTHDWLAGRTTAYRHR